MLTLAEASLLSCSAAPCGQYACSLTQIKCQTPTVDPPQTFTGIAARQRIAHLRYRYTSENRRHVFIAANNRSTWTVSVVSAAKWSRYRAPGRSSTACRPRRRVPIQRFCYRSTVVWHAPASAWVARTTRAANAGNQRRR